jgi:Methyltransferase domain
VAVEQDLLPRVAAKARRTIYPLLPPSFIELGRAARFVARSARMTARGYRFGSEVQSVEVPVSAPDSDRPPNDLRSYVEGHHEGRGVYKGRHYFDIYVQHLSRFVGREVTVVEVGVYSGGSLEMWKRYFGDHATIHGVDIQEACRVYEGGGVHIHIGDQGDRAFWTRFKEDVPFIDVLIDDGGHHPDEMRVTFEELFPIMRPGGVYICEDIVSNAFLAYLGGFAEHLMTYTNTPLVEPGVASGFFSAQAGAASAADSLQQAVRSIHLYPFLAVVERTVEPVTDFQFPMYGSEWQPF